jgi:hypothetical protein
MLFAYRSGARRAHFVHSGGSPVLICLTRAGERLFTEIAGAVGDWSSALDRFEIATEPADAGLFRYLSASAQRADRVPDASNGCTFADRAEVR